MKKILCLTTSFIFVFFCAPAQSRQFLEEKCKPILAEMGIDSTQFKIFTIQAGNKRAIFAQTNKTDLVIDTLAKKLYFRIVADSVKKYDHISIVHYIPNQTEPISKNYSMSDRLFKRP